MKETVTAFIIFMLGITQKYREIGFQQGYSKHRERFSGKEEKLENLHACKYKLTSRGKYSLVTS